MRISRHWPALLPAAFVFALAFVLIPSVIDVDLWGHVRFGADIVAARHVPAIDAYSFTADKAWVNHEWFAEVLMYLAYVIGKSAGLNALRLLLIGATLWFVARALEGCDRKRVVMIVMWVAVLTYPRTEHIRPQLFSIVLFAAMLLVLTRSHDSLRRLYWVPVIMAAWVNLHGGWILGLGVFVLWAGIHFVWPASGSPDRRRLGVAVAASLCATLVNPYGFRLWAFVFETVGVQRPDILEWSSIPRSQAGIVAFWCVSAIAGVIFVSRAIRTRTHAADSAIVLTLCALSFRVSRLDAFLALAVFILGGRILAASAVRPAPDLRPEYWLRRPVIATAIVCAFAARPSALTDISLASANWLPDPNGLAFIQSRGLQGNMLTYFDWGEYAIWYLSPRVKVSMDGRRETVYSSTVIGHHLDVYRTRDEGAAYIRHLQPALIWLPRGLEVVSALEASGEWDVAYQDRTSVVLTRGSLGPAPQTFTQPARRVFPGP